MPEVDVNPLWDTTVVIADTVVLPVSTNNGWWTFIWEDTTGLSCSNCSYPFVNPLEDVIYNVTVDDILGCGATDVVLIIELIKDIHLEMPTAFTPNGDDNNDIISLEGWAVKDLLSFQIFNRWGEKVFETDNMEQGWDGYYKGKLHNNDIYVYKISAMSYYNVEHNKEGYFTLLK